MHTRSCPVLGTRRSLPCFRWNRSNLRLWLDVDDPALTFVIAVLALSIGSNMGSARHSCGTRPTRKKRVAAIAVIAATVVVVRRHPRLISAHSARPLKSQTTPKTVSALDFGGYLYTQF